MNGILPDGKQLVRFDQLAPGSLHGGVLLTIHRLSEGGADRVTMLLANGFAEAGMPTAIVVLRTGGEAERTLLGLLHPDVIVRFAGPAMGSRHLELLRGLCYIHRQVRRAQPATVLASSSNMGLVTGICARLMGRRRPRFIMKLTNPVIRPRDNGALRAFYRRRLYGFIFASYDRALILTDAEKTGLIRMFPWLSRRFDTVANPYVSATMNAHDGRIVPDGGPWVVALARMMPQKRLDRLLAAFARVKTPGARLIILGDGPERGQLERQSVKLGIEDRIKMPGFVEDVVPWLRRADLFALSSDYEGLPAAVLEALACNVPVVTTDCFDAAKSLLAGAVRCAVVPRDDVDAFARAIDESLSASDQPTDLHERAAPYRFEAAIAAHVGAVGSTLSSAGRRGL
jgi:glycosyltransferase involved in cell wall biosynthesis